MEVPGKLYMKISKVKSSLMRIAAPLVGRRYVLFDQSQTYDMSFNELMGAIFVRSQFIEQLMREMLKKHQSYRIPRNFNEKTFGSLLNDLKLLYPDLQDIKEGDYIMLGTTMYDDLVDARDIRNEAAHGTFLVGLTVMDLLHNYGSKADKRRLVLRGMRKSLWMMDYCMVDFYRYCANHGLKLKKSKKN